MPARKTNANDANAELLASVIAAPRSADIARLLEVNGKTVRNYVRHTLGKYVSKGASLTDDDKRALFDKFGPKQSA